MSESCPLLVLDTSVFIEAHRRYYSRDICPGFWDILEHYTRNGKVSSIDRVLDELTQPSNPDELEKWAKQAPKELFASAAELRVINVFSQMQLWAQKTRSFGLRQLMNSRGVLMDGLQRMQKQMAQFLSLRKCLRRVQRSEFPYQTSAENLTFLT